MRQSKSVHSRVRASAVRDARPDVLFCVASPNQLADACLVMAEMQAPVLFLDLTTATVSREVPSIHGPAGRPTARKVFAVLRCIASARPRVLVIGQDHGILHQASACAARLTGAKLVLLPDGVCFAETDPRRRGLVATWASCLLVSCAARRPVPPRGLGWGATRPDLVLTWGTGWLDMFAARGGRALVTGSPRAVRLLPLARPPGKPAHLLVCDQPLAGSELNQVEAQELWDGWLRRILASAPRSRLRVRLHPSASHDRAWLAPYLATTTLDEDLAWCDAVVSPMSTALLEASAVGRAVGRVRLNHDFEALVRQHPCFADGAIAVIDLDSDFEGCVAQVETRAGPPFLEHLADSPARAASAIRGLLAPRA